MENKFFLLSEVQVSNNFVFIASSFKLFVYHAKKTELTQVFE
jgi:hypothetical protein